MLAAITVCLHSCGWFSTKSKTMLTGKWKVIAVKDRSIAGLRGTSFFGGFNADSTNWMFEFITDSTLTTSNAKEPKTDTVKYHTDAAYHFIYVQEQDSKPDTFPVLSLTDTLLTVVRDSIHVTLKRQP